jgi:cytochrome c2
MASTRIPTGTNRCCRKPYIQSSCGKCHLSIFSEEQSFEGIAVFREGQKIFNREGCLGCHKARGVGGIIGPDLTEQGEKTRHEYSFQNIETEQTISNWLKEHFRDPEMVSPGSQMLKIDLPEEELDALTTFVLGLAKPDIAFEYFSLETLNEFKGNRSTLNPVRAFSMACSGCHGREGAGKGYEEYKTGVPAILGEDFQRVASPEYIEFTLLKGRSQRDMASWAVLCLRVQG